MKLIEALNILSREQPGHGQLFEIYLVLGFTPLHFQSFLAAQLRLLLPDRQVSVKTGLYGDFWGNLERAGKADADARVILLEWNDLDPRLGLRNLGSWAPIELDDICGIARTRLAQLQEALQVMSRSIPIALCPPTLPLPPVSYAPTWQTSAIELELREYMSALCSSSGRLRNVRIVNPQQLGRLSPLNARFNVKSELTSGFPYRLSHASTLAEMVARLVRQPTAKKGLITDLDDTLWKGILGEIGIEGVSWDLEHESHMHGAYQRFLHALAEAGILLGVASKNDPRLVTEALQKRELIVPASVLFPIEANWGAKSESVGQILKTWNVGADAVVFLDDSPMELAEVKSAHPEIEVILFPKDDPQAIYDLLYHLRDLFGKDTISEEDVIRRESLRRTHNWQRDYGIPGKVPTDFLKTAESELILSFRKEPWDPRALELVNKSNQFNLNGKRFTDALWQKYINQPNTLLLIASYRDKYGPLGKIAVLAGRLEQKTLCVDVWVMSCRAFSRGIEHRCLDELFERFQLDEMLFDFEATSKNSPLSEFLKDILGDVTMPQLRLTRDQFLDRRMETFHRVLELTNG